MLAQLGGRWIFLLQAIQDSIDLVHAAGLAFARGTSILAQGSYYTGRISDAFNSQIYTVHSVSRFSERLLPEIGTFLEVNLEIFVSGRGLLAQVKPKLREA